MDGGAGAARSCQDLRCDLKSLPSKDSDHRRQAGEHSPANARFVEAIYTKPYMAHASIGPSCAVAEFKDGKMTVWTHSQGVFPLRGELVKALKMPAAAVRCIHTEGSGCYGHNGADDVAVDAALLARALPGRPVRLQWMREDEFKWEPYGAAMVMRAKAAIADGKIADWEYELWSNTHSTRPQSTSGTNVLAAWYLGAPQKHGPAHEPAATGRWRRPQLDPAIRFPQPAGDPPFCAGHADSGVGATHARRLCQRVCAGVLHGRTGGGGRRRPGGVPPGAS